MLRLAISFVNACEGCTWVPKLASDRLMSVMLFGRIPFGKCRRESANFPEDSVTPRYEKMCNLSPHHLPPSSSEIHIWRWRGGDLQQMKKQQLSSEFSGSPRRYFTNVVFTFSGFWLANKIEQKCSLPLITIHSDAGSGAYGLKPDGG